MSLKLNRVELVIDIGNSSAKLAVFDKNEIVDIFYDSNRDISQLDNLCKKYKITKGIISSVVKISDTINRQINSLPFKAFILSHSTSIPIINDYKSPQTLGMDRIAAVIGAEEIKPERDLLIIDAGTCITYDFIDSNGHYKGGNISPGVEMRFKALKHYTDKLPYIDKDGKTLLIGEDTETAIRSGVTLGVEHEIVGYISLMRNKYPQLLVFLTGGNDFSFDTKLKSIIFVDKFLVLKGLNRIIHYNEEL